MIDWPQRGLEGAMVDRSVPFVAILSTLALVACTSSGPKKNRFEREFQRYLSMPNQKAMAIAGDPNGRWVYGYGYAAGSSGHAEVTAMEACNRRRNSLGPDAECSVYAIGSKVVWKSPQPAPTN